MWFFSIVEKSKYHTHKITIIETFRVWNETTISYSSLQLKLTVYSLFFFKWPKKRVIIHKNGLKYILNMELYNFLCSAVTPLLVLPRVAECWTCGGSFGCAWWCSVSVADRLALPLQGGHSWTRDPLQRTKTNHLVKYQNNNNGNLSCRSWRCPVFQIWPNPNPEVGVKIYLSDSQKITVEYQLIFWF